MNWTFHGGTSHERFSQELRGFFRREFSSFGSATEAMLFSSDVT